MAQRDLKLIKAVEKHRVPIHLVSATKGSQYCAGSSSMEPVAGPLTQLNVVQGTEGTVRAQLQQKNIWGVFSKQQNEMLLNRAGRRMFPVPEFQIEGLDPKARYSCKVRLVSVDSLRYKWDMRTSSWTSYAGLATEDSTQDTYVHPERFPLGDHWLTKGARFDKLKLSNHSKPSSDHVVLSSLQKYAIQLIVTSLDAQHGERWTFDFPETEFIAVTCYQNPRVTALKIAYNPYAKAFRLTCTRRQDDDTEQSIPAKNRAPFSSCQSSVSCAPPPLTVWTKAPVPSTTTDHVVFQKSIAGEETIVRTGYKRKAEELVEITAKRPRLHATAPAPAQYTQYTLQNSTVTYGQDFMSCDYIPEGDSRYIPVMGDPFQYQPPVPMTSQSPYATSLSGSFHLEFSGSFCNQETTNQNLPWPPANQELTSQMTSWSPGANQDSINHMTSWFNAEPSNLNAFWSPSPVRPVSANQMLQWSPMSVHCDQDLTNHSSSYSLPVAVNLESANHSWSWSLPFSPEFNQSESADVPYSWKSVPVSRGCGQFGGYDVTQLGSSSRLDGAFLREN